MKRVLALLVVAIIGCAKHSPTSLDETPIAPVVSKPVALVPGRFSVSYLDGLRKVVADSTSDSTVSVFNLGVLDGSRNQFFLIGNSGDLSIRSVGIHSGDSLVVSSPDSIGQIAPSRQTTILPIIKVTLVHGITLEGGIGTRPLQSSGQHSQYLRITGVSSTTPDSQGRSRDTMISMNVRLDYVVRVFDFKLSCAGQNIDLPTGNPQTDGTWMYNLGAKDSSITVTNSGSCPLVLTVYKFGYGLGGMIETTQVVYPGQNFRGIFSQTHLYLDVYGGGVVSDVRKLKINSEGRMIIHLWRIFVQ